MLSSGWLWVAALVIVVRTVATPLASILAGVGDAQAAIGPVDMERLMRAFDMLGPERVALGLTATGHGWGDCFLSSATGGQPYGLRPALTKGWRTNRVPALSAEVTQAVVRVWDQQEGAFRQLAAQWLERQPGREESHPTRVRRLPSHFRTQPESSR